jgi:hypothetical protein
MGWEPSDGVTLRAFPSMADQFHRLAQNLSTLAHRHRGDLSLPAGTVVVAVAALEAYVNEVAEMALTAQDQRADFDRLRDNLLAKLRWLGEHGKRPDRLSEVTVGDVELLYGLRGILMHYRPVPEHPDETRTTFQRMAERFPAAVVGEGEISTERLLTSELASWAVEVIEAAIKQLYDVGWSPPRPFWLELVDPDEWARQHQPQTSPSQ